MRKHTLILAVFLLAVLSVAAISCNYTSPEQRANTLEEQKKQILHVLGFAGTSASGTSLCDYIVLIETSDPEGNPCHIGEINPLLDSRLDLMVGSYNSDPATTEPIAVEEVRFSLTEGIIEATDSSNRESPFVHFIRWLGIAPNLVYSEDQSSGEEITHHAGDPVTSSTLTNYRFLIETSDIFSNYKYIWK